MSAPLTRATDDHQLSRHLAVGGGELLLMLKTRIDLPAAELGKLGDAIANRYLTQALGQWRGDDGLLSEEGPADLARLVCRRTWIVDPLDGTREYSETGSRTDWAVHVALCEDGQPVAGAVALPALGLCFDTASVVLAPPAPGRLRLAISRTRAPGAATEVARHLDADLVRMGSAGAKAMAVVQGTVHAYLALGAMSEWDSCAPVAVARAAGLHVSHIDGRALRFNKPEPHTRDLLICRPEIAAPLLAALASIDCH